MGGSGSSEFAQLRSFQSFSKQHLSTLQKWAGSIWEKGFLELYYVQDIGNFSGKYDFKNKGYWMKLSAGLNSPGSPKKIGYIDLDQFRATYTPKNRYEKDREQGDVLFRISPEEAEKLQTSRTRPSGYAVYKIKLMPNGISPYNSYNFKQSRMDFIFHLVDPVVELYRDIELTDKIGEVSFESAIYK